MQISLYTTLQKVVELPSTFTKLITPHRLFFKFTRSVLFSFCSFARPYTYSKMVGNLVLLFSSSHNRHPMPRFDVNVNFHFPVAVERIVSANVRAK